MQFIDLKRQYGDMKTRMDQAVLAVLEHGQYILGPEVRALESKLSDWSDNAHVAGVANGTDALVLALKALGIGPGDAVITTSFSFFASAESIALVGARPVFADIEPGSYNLCAQSLDDAVKSFRASHPAINLKAVIAVDLFGQPANYAAISKVANEHELRILADGAQSFGATQGGVPVGALGDIATTSFFPAKPLGCYGDGGAVFSKDEALINTVRSLRVHGKGSNKYDNVAIGTNSRLDTIQAAILLVKLDAFAEEIKQRNAVADRYAVALGERFHVPGVAADSASTWAQYCLRAKDSDREQHLGALKSAGVPSAVYYRVPLHLQPALADLGYRAGQFPVSEKMSQEIFSVPMHPYLDEELQQKVIDALLG
ncbi:MAG: DegT/DnrJ/EryC1/StrS family aminotransferase [Gammaproteobacteria bacterium]